MGIFLWLLYGSVQTTGNVFGSVLMVIFKHIKVIGSGFGLELVLVKKQP